MSKRLMNDITHLHALNEQLIEMPLNGSRVALELTVNSTISSPKTNSNIEASSERVYTESDRETESSSEREDCKSDEKVNSGTENYVTPSKSFLIDHRYTNKKWSNYLSVNPSKNLNTCFDKLSQGSDQCENKLLHEVKNMLEVITDEIVKTVPNLNSHKTFKNCPQDFFLDNYPLNRNEGHVTDSINIERSNINTEHCFNILSAGVVSAEDQKTFHSYQNSSAVQTSDIPEEPKAIELDSNVIKEIVKNPPVVLLTPINVHLHHKTEFETLKKTVKLGEETKHVNISSSANSLQDHYVKKSADEGSSACSIANSTLTNKSEEMGNNFTLEPEKDTYIVNMELSNSLCSEISGQSQTENQNDLKMSHSKPMQNLISSQNLNSCSVSEDSRNDRSVISDIEHIDKGRPNEVNDTEATFVSSEIEKLISEIQNNSFQSKTLQNPTSLQNVISCSIAENSMDNRNFISNIKHCDKAKSSKLIKSYDVDNTETGFIDFKVEKIISEIDSTENNTLHNLTSLPNLVSCANSENSKDSIKNKNVISNIECFEKVRPSELIRSNEADNTDTVFIDSAVGKIISEIDSAENEALQNLTSLPNLISCAISENLLSNMNVISNIEHIDKVKPSGFIRSNEADDIEAPIGSTFEKNITEITHKDSVSSESNSLPLLTKNHSNIPSSSPEELNYLENKTNISDKKSENVSKTIAENILLPSMTDAYKSANNDVKIVPKFLNVENDKNIVNLQQKDILFSTPSVYIETSTRSVAVNENNNLVKNLACELTTPEVKKTDEPVKVSSVDSTKAEKLTSYPIIMREKDLDPLYNMFNNPNPLDNLMNTTKKSKEDSHFIPRSVNIKTAKTMHSSDLRNRQNSKKESTSNFLNLVPNSNVERNKIFNTSEINNSVIDSEIDIKRREILQIPESNKTLIDKALKGIFTNEDEADERGNGTSFQPNIVHLRSVSDIGKINSSDNENRKKCCTPSLNILSENQKMPANNVIKSTNKPTTGFNFDHNESSIENKNIVFLSKQLSQAGASSKIQPHSVEFSAKKFPNTSCTSPKRKHTDSISNLVSKRPRIPERLHLNNLAWTVNFPASLTPAENLNRKKEDKIDSVSLLTNNSSSVYFTEICNSQLANEIPGIITDHSNITKSIKNQENSEIINTEDLNSKNLGDSDSGSSSDSDSGSSSDSDSSSSNKTSSSSKTKSSDSKSQSKVPNNQDERNNSLKDSQAAQSVVSDFVESIPSESEDEIQVIEEISNINKNGKNFKNSLSSSVMNKRQKCTSFNSTNQTRNQSLVKTPTKPKQSSQMKHPDIPRNRQLSLFNFLEDACTDKLIKPKKSIKTEQKTPKKFDNLGQSVQKNPYSSSSSSSVKTPRLSQTSFTSVPDINTSIPVSHSKASCSRNQDDIQCLNVDEDCFIIEQDNVHVITLD
ncbi:unnamed protein product [Larinioides sclopetarius]|uniref:Uncharacterized protein n=1 Tax=Larinioides sclopetarius TaxID=280406 RepID=A0AAV2A0H8_9ARAC